MPRIPLYIGGFFAFPGDKIFGALPYTAQTAVDHINNLTGILDGYELRMRWRLTDVSSTLIVSTLPSMVLNCFGYCLLYS